MASVRLKNVRKVYDGVIAVHGISLDIRDRDFVVLVGPSGCGKSTTLRMIAGLEEITEGELLIDGKNMNNVAPKDRDIAMVFQNYALYPHMTVYENMAFGLKLRKLSKKEIEERVREAANVLGIEDCLDRKPKALSGGQRQRVAVGRAIVRKPKVFLFDEPLSNLDAKLRVQMRTEISKLHQRLDATMIYVTHDQTEAMTMADTIVLMKEGRVQQMASPMEIYERPVNKFVAGFIGSPAMNFVDGLVEKKQLLTFVEFGNGLRLDIPKQLHKKLLPYTGKEIICGIRPEHISSKERKSGKRSTHKVSVEVVEPMGNETYVYFTTRSHSPSYVARLTAAKGVRIGEPTILAIDTTRIHFFDKNTELAIR
jgi:multiple sugar transport system ATP-binding protein